MVVSTGRRSLTQAMQMERLCAHRGCRLWGRARELRQRGPLHHCACEQDLVAEQSTGRPALAHRNLIIQELCALEHSSQSQLNCATLTPQLRTPKTFKKKTASPSSQQAPPKRRCPLLPSAVQVSFSRFFLRYSPLPAAPPTRRPIVIPPNPIHRPPRAAQIQSPPSPPRKSK